VTFTLQPGANGILPDRMIAAMADAGLILPAYPFVESQIQPASLDLRLGDIAYRVRASFLPGPGATVAERIDQLKLHEIDLTDGAVLETNCVYIVPLLESLALPPEIVAAANPKSSTGRLDVFTRVIADGTRRFDMIGAGYHGPLYAEISPKTFPVLLREGSRLSQVRFRTGDAVLNADELEALHEAERLVDVDDADLVNGVALSVDLSGKNANGFVGYRAKRHTGVVDIDRRGGYAVDEFWEPIAARSDGSLILDPGEFYILATTPRRWCRSIPWSANSACIMPASSIPASAMPAPAGRARARCWKCARAKCRSFSSTARSSAGWCTKECWRGPTPCTASASARTTRRRA
jgi:dCTP deaminase